MNPANALSQLSPGMAECHARLMAVAKHGTPDAFSATLAGVLHRAELSISNAYDAGAKSIQVDAAANGQAPAGATDPDGEAFRAAAHLGLTLRFYGGCAQSGMPATPSAYEVVAGGDRAAAMREAVQRAVAVIENGGESQPPAPAATADVLQVFIEKKGRVRIFIYNDELHSTLTHTRSQSSAR